jgi:hypothetical protein
MAHFRGLILGGRGETTRLGTKNSGLITEAQSWEGKATVILTHDHTGHDVASFALMTHYGNGKAIKLLSLRVDGSDANAYHIISQILASVEPEKRAATLDAVARDMGLTP